MAYAPHDYTNLQKSIFETEGDAQGFHHYVNVSEKDHVFHHFNKGELRKFAEQHLSTSNLFSLFTKSTLPCPYCTQQFEATVPFPLKTMFSFREICQLKAQELTRRVLQIQPTGYQMAAIAIGTCAALYMLVG